jgi:transcriptional regulator with XRE-family HTH domain
VGPKGIFIPGDFLRFHRNRLAMLQRELAAVMGVNDGRIRHLEAGDFGGVRQPAFRKLAELLKTDVDGLRSMIIEWQARKNGVGPLIPPKGFVGVKKIEADLSQSKEPQSGAAPPAPSESKRRLGDNRPGRRKQRRGTQ